MLKCVICNTHFIKINSYRYNFRYIIRFRFHSSVYNALIYTSKVLETMVSETDYILTLISKSVSIFLSGSWMFVIAGSKRYSEFHFNSIYRQLHLTLTGNKGSDKYCFIIIRSVWTWSCDRTILIYRWTHTPCRINFLIFGTNLLFSI